MTLSLPRVIGHRGAKLHAPENTFAGLREAAAQGATWVEVDVMLSRDGVPFLHHDETLLRTAGLDRKVAETDWSVIEQLDAGASFSAAFQHRLIPKLESAIQVMREVGLGCNFEMKPTEGCEVETVKVALPVIQKAVEAGLATPLISSFQLRCLEVAQEIAPELPRGLLIDEVPQDCLEQARRLGCATINPWWEPLTREQVEAMKKEGYLVAVYTCNDPEAAKRMVEWGVDSVITDSPALIIEALKGL